MQVGFTRLPFTKPRSAQVGFGFPSVSVTELLQVSLFTMIPGPEIPKYRYTMIPRPEIARCIYSDPTLRSQGQVTKDR